MMPALKKYYLLFCICQLGIFFCVKAQVNPIAGSADGNLTAMIDSVAAAANEDSSKPVRPHFRIGEIVITGNKKTKSYYIERELPFKKGDSMQLPQIVEKFKSAREWLMNTRLFNDVVVSLKSFRGYDVDIAIDVKERWYIFPIPYFKPIDRNVSAWASKGYSLDRINYGLKFTYYNFTGRNDKLRLWVVTGYTRQIQLQYEQPYADRSLKHGFGAGFVYSAFKEVNTGTSNNEQRFINSDTIPYAGRFLNETWSLFATYNYRPALRTKHAVRLALNFNRVDSAVLVENPKFFNNGKETILYPELSYAGNYMNVDYAPYPLRGFMADFGFVRKGINKNMNLWEFSGSASYSKPLGSKFYYNVAGNGTVKLPFNQPFYNLRLLGYRDFYLRGLEKYVIDGVVGGLVKNTLRREILNTHIPIPFFKTRSHDRLPLRIYAKTYTDWGYVHNPVFKTNSLTNQLLYTGGFGIDVVTLYDLVLRFEYSFNQLGEKGFFFHVKNDF